MNHTRGLAALLPEQFSANRFAKVSIATAKEAQNAAALKSVHRSIKGTSAA